MLSVIILAKNEEKMIKACLESVKFADEIIFYDNESSDKTVEIAKKYTDKIFSFKNLDYAEVKNKAFEKTKGDWVFYIYADERVLELLKEEIVELIQNDDGKSKFAAYALTRKNIIFGKPVNYGLYKHDWIIRLVKRDVFKGWTGKVHETLNFEGSLGYSKNSLLHLTHRNLDQIVLKSLEWSNIDAHLRLDSNHPKMSGWRFLRIFMTEIWNQGILRGGFFNGDIAMMDSLLQVFSMNMTYIRLWELQQKESIDKVYQEIDQKLMDSNFKY
jgi:glycosyltransferase involved in cell wall biosynthesis